MTKLRTALRLSLLAGLATLAGCQLYFGDSEGSDNWTYCGSDGYYTCQGDDCEWAGPTCPTGTTEPGFACETNADCAAGCYCATDPNNATAGGTCEEAGFCSTDADCPDNFFCDDRSSCVPSTCTCTNDAEAQEQGFGYCDETNSTCEVGVDPAGSCGGSASGTPPTCGAGSVPLILDGAYTGECKSVAQCDVVPACEAHSEASTDENDCLARTDCQAVYVGINCTNPTTGQTCVGGQAGCVCADFRFNSCTTSDGNQ